MNGKDIFVGLSYIDQKLVEEAEHGQFPKSKVRSLRRPVLIAAVIAMLLMLTGCAVAYVLSVKDMKVANSVGERPMIVDDKHTFVGMTEATYQVISLNGLKGTPNYEASKEWYEFKQKFDPDHKIAIAANPRPEYPAEYYAYNLYADEMKDAVDKITQKYNLNLVGEKHDFLADMEEHQQVFDILGIDRPINPGENIRVANWIRGHYYTGGNFFMCFDTVTEDGSWPYNVSIVFWYLRKDVFDPIFLELDETLEWKEWLYTTKSGSDVLMLHSDDSWAAFMICDREDSVIVVRFDGVHEGWYEDGQNTWADRDIMPQAQMEQFADAINFAMQPNIDLSSVGESH